MYWDKVCSLTYLLYFDHGTESYLPFFSLARTELLLVIGKVFREVNFELYQTTREDVTLAHELFLPFPKLGSKGVRALVVD